MQTPVKQVSQQLTVLIQAGLNFIVLTAYQVPNHSFVGSNATDRTHPK